MKRRRGEDEATECRLCKHGRHGEYHHYYAGQHIDTKKKRAFLSSTTHITSTYQGVQRYAVFVCDVCATRLRKGRHFGRAVGYTLVTVACAVGALVGYLKDIAPGQTGWMLGCFGLIGGLFALMAILEWMGYLNIGGSSIDDLIVNILKKDPRLTRDQGDTLFTESEYQVLFKDAPQDDIALTADELIARDRGRSGGSRRKKENDEDSRECPHCQESIPAYAGACRHCKKILDDY